MWPRKLRNYLRNIGALAGALLAAPALAQPAPELCEPIELPDIVGCSPAAMRDAMSDEIPAGMWRDPDRVVQSGATFPGGASLSFSGLVNDRGAACAQPLSALTAEAMLMSGQMDRDEAVSRATARAEELREELADAARAGDRRSRIEALRRATGMGPDGSGGSLGHLLGEGDEARDVVLEIYSPTAWGFDTGGLLPPRGIEHDGATGWMPNAGSAILVQLPGVSADDLRPGETYEAVAYAPDASAEEPGPVVPTAGGFYSRWQGSYHTYAPRHGQSGGDMQTQALLQDIDRMLSESSGNSSGLARRAASGQGRAFAGQTERVSGRLEGEVLIEAITAGAIYGRIALEGEASVTTEVYALTRDDDGAIDGDEKVETRERSGHLAIEGRFEAPNGGRMVRMTHAPVPVSARGGERSETLRVVAQLPGDNARNMDPDAARFELVFDRVLDPTSIETDTIWIEYLPFAGSSLRRVETHVRVERDSLLIEPVRPLPDGAWHRLRMDAGEDGPEGRDGARLELPFSSRFATLPDDIEVETEVYQVVRDAPLIANKTTAARLYVEWEPPIDVHEDWLVEDIPVNAWAEDEGGGALYAVREDTLAPHREMVTEEEERTGRNTVNLFGWSPVFEQTGTVTGVIEPIDSCGNPYEEVRGDEGVSWSPLQRHFSFDYFIARVGEWAYRMPEEGRAIARQTVRSSEAYATQSFPVTGVSGHYAGDYVPSDAWLEQYNEALLAGDDNARARLMLEIYDRVPLINGPDQTVVFFPPSVMSGGSSLRGWYDLGMVDGEDRIYALHLNPMVEIVTIPRAAETPALTHEFGHGLGLDHMPAPADALERAEMCNNPRYERIPGIDGFRLALNGEGGATKSSEDGNAEHLTIMRGLMFPCAGDKAEHFIHPDQYEALMERFSEPVLSRNAPGGGPGSYIVDPVEASQSIYRRMGALLNGPVAHADDGPMRSEREFVLAGEIGPDGDTATITRVAEPGRELRRSGPEGEFTAILFAADGSELARRPFGTLLLQETGGPFRTAVPAAEAPARVEIRRGSTVLASRSRSAAAPVVDDFRIAGHDVESVRLEWTVSDADDDPLEHFVLYRSGPEDVWHPVVLRTGRSSATIRRETLVTGPAPALRLVSSDGFNAGEADLDASGISIDPPAVEMPEVPDYAPQEPDAEPGPPRFGGPAGSEAAPEDAETEGGGAAVAADASAAGTAASDALGVMEGRLFLEGTEYALTVERCESQGGNVQFGASAPAPGGGSLRIGGSMMNMGPRAFQIVEVRSLDAAGNESGPVWVAIRNGADGAWQNGFSEPADGRLLTAEGDRLLAQGDFFERSGSPRPAGEGRMEVRCEMSLE